MLFIFGCSDHNNTLQSTIFLKRMPGFESHKQRIVHDEIKARLFDVLSKRGFDCNTNTCESNVGIGDKIYIIINNSSNPDEATISIKGNNYASFSTSPSKSFIKKLKYWREVISILSDTMLEYEVKYGKNFV